MPRMRVGAVLLAAGRGASRLGNPAQSPAATTGVPLINRHLIALSGAGVDEVVVVWAFITSKSRLPFKHFLCRWCATKIPQRAGLALCVLVSKPVGERFDAVIMMLCDQP